MKLRCFKPRLRFAAILLVLSLAAAAVFLYAELDEPPQGSEGLDSAAGPQPLGGTETPELGEDASGGAGIGGPEGSDPEETVVMEELRRGLLLFVSWTFLVVGLLLVALTLRKTYLWMAAVQKAKHPPTRYFNLQLKVRGADGSLSIHNFDYYPVIVASSGTADLLLPGQSGEQSRFRIDYGQGEARLTADASLIVNGVPRKQKSLRQGDRIVFGSYRLDFKDASVREQSAPMPGKPVFAWQFPIVALLLALSVLFKQAGTVPQDTVLAKAAELRAVEQQAVEFAVAKAPEAGERETPFIRSLLAAVFRRGPEKQRIAETEADRKLSKEEEQAEVSQPQVERVVRTTRQERQEQKERQDIQSPERVAASKKLARREAPEARQPATGLEVPLVTTLEIPTPTAPNAAAALESAVDTSRDRGSERSKLDRFDAALSTEEQAQRSGEASAIASLALRSAVEQPPSLQASVLGTVAAVEEQIEAQRRTPDVAAPDRGDSQKTKSAETLSLPARTESEIESTGARRVTVVAAAASLPAESRQTESRREEGPAEDRQEVVAREDKVTTRSDAVAARGDDAAARTEKPVTRKPVVISRSRSLPQPGRVKVRVVAPGRPIEFFKADVLFIHAHPDDESIDFGTLMARASRSGKRIATLLFTDGESGLDLYPQRKIGDIYPARPLEGRALSQVRVVEATRALSILGSEMYIRWGLRNRPYNTLKDVVSTEEVIEGWGGEEKLLAELEEILEGFRPTVIVSPDEHSKAWEHFEHEAVGYLVKKAIGRLRSTGQTYLKGYLVSVDPYQKDRYSELIGIEALDHDPQSDFPYRSIQASALKEHVTQRDAALIGVSRLSNLPLEYYKVMYWELSGSVQGYLK